MKSATETPAKNKGQTPMQKTPGLIFIYLALAIVTFAVFSPALRCDFVNYDDGDYVYDNKMVQRGLTMEGVKWAFTTSHVSNWHPLTWISHMIDCQIFKLRPAGHHLVNLLFHVANTLLLFGLLRKMTGAIWRSLLVAALFALHPLRVESVVWIAERKDVLSTFLWLLTTIFYVRYVEQSKIRNPKSKISYALALSFFTLGLLAKPMLVTLPFALLLLDFWPLGRARLLTSRDQNLGSRGRSPSQLILEKIPFFALTVASCVVTFFAQRAWGAVYSVTHLPVSSRLSNALVSYARYLEKMFFPHDLALPYPLPNGWPVWLVALSVLVVIGLSFFAIWQARSRPYIFFGWFWYLGTLVPVIGIVQVGMQAMADRYAYIPLIGIFIAIIWGAADLTKNWAQQRKVYIFSSAAILMACIAVTLHQIKFWHDGETLFKHTVAVTKGNFFAHYNLGNRLNVLGKTEEAIEHFKAAVEINPSYASAYNNLGISLEKLGRKEEAAKYYALALQSDSGGAVSHLNFGNTLLESGKTDQAIAEYLEALRLNPKLPEGHYNFGIVLLQQQKVSEAISHFQSALAERPSYLDASFALGTALAQAGKNSEAEQNFLTVIRTNPDHFGAHKKYGDLLVGMGRLDEAITHYSKALQLNPKDAELHNGLGIAFASQGKMDEALPHFREAVRLQPQFTGALGNLGNALASQGKLDEAIPQYRAALQVAPNDEEIHGNMATALFQQNKLEESIEHYNAALKLNPNNVQTRFNFALVLARSGKNEEAIAQLREALRIKPDFVQAQQQLEAWTGKK